MKTLTKTILGLGLTAFAFGSFAATDKWERGSVDSSFSPLIRLGLFKNGAGQLNVGITFPTDTCLTFTQDVLKAPSYKINGVSVKMYAQCVGKGLRMDFPATNKGKDYVISELRTKQSVTYEQEGVEVTFSAIGFTKSVESVSKSDEGI
ncbi:hypothetical protein [Vibrio fluvialis]|uniref:hypothetical protein n=1 Tax=Vibrio fluvialis TaxID=676 RepID=UPI001C9BF6F0|nr:hypothetical protein [Vibrio fluvialis]ELO1779512.1 hypothetical protein [Vibrio fluvialis]MBY7771468.1 hypothetical protein [Vibrio fluvialis]MBY8053996.1 hypothetical protein [Vibrio fluvialis]MBY8095793.1 hypothetical protein [Vibrio fluvialis]MBY8217477.1 hypothetical protein [Vibrio fluvialis]